MRKRALSEEGVHLYLNGMTSAIPTKKLFCNLFHSDYDDRLDSVVENCRESTKCLCVNFDDPQLRERLDAGILHTVRLVLTRDQKNMKKKYAYRNYNFFLDVMKRAFNENDHQTASMIAIALNDPAITRLPIKKPKRAAQYIKDVLDSHGWANANKHMKYLQEVDDVEVLPSLITFAIYLKRQQCFGLDKKAHEAELLLKKYKNMVVDLSKVLPIYKQKRLKRKELMQLSAALMQIYS